MFKVRRVFKNTQRFSLLKFKKPVYTRLNKIKRPALVKAPQRKGVVKRVRIKAPRKPNSARRPVIKVKLTSRRYVVAHIPGGSHNLRRYSKVLVAGKGPKDLPGVHYTGIRGSLDFEGSRQKTKRRSVYGVQLPIHLKTYIRKKLRNKQ